MFSSTSLKRKSADVGSIEMEGQSKVGPDHFEHANAKFGRLERIIPVVALSIMAFVMTVTVAILAGRSSDAGDCNMHLPASETVTTVAPSPDSHPCAVLHARIQVDTSQVDYNVLFANLAKACASTTLLNETGLSPANCRTTMETVLSMHPDHPRQAEEVCRNTVYTTGGTSSHAFLEKSGDCPMANDGYCDKEAIYNKAGCGYDGGDCCKDTCVSSSYTCGDAGYDCKDPDYKSCGWAEWAECAGAAGETVVSCAAAETGIGAVGCVGGVAGTGSTCGKCF